jgi:hypothetical protein
LKLSSSIIAHQSRSDTNLGSQDKLTQQSFLDKLTSQLTISNAQEGSKLNCIVTLATMVHNLSAKVSSIEGHLDSIKETNYKRHTTAGHVEDFEVL